MWKKASLISADFASQLRVASVAALVAPILVTWCILRIRRDWTDIIVWNIREAADRDAPIDE